MHHIFQTYRFTQSVEHLPSVAGSTFTYALSAISVWRALDADRSLRVLGGSSDECLVAELTFSSERSQAAHRELCELCVDHGLRHELLSSP